MAHGHWPEPWAGPGSGHGLARQALARHGQASASLPGAGLYLLVDIAVKAALTTIDKITALTACNG